jgi:hypothetical protein
MSLRRIFVLLCCVSAVTEGQVAAPSPTTSTTPPKGRNSIVADGTIQNVLKGDDQSRPAAGSLGFTHLSKSGKERFSAFIAVVNAQDTLSGNAVRKFGRALLTAGTSSAGSAFSSLTADYQRFFDYGTEGQRHGPRAYLGLAQTTWRSEREETPQSGEFNIVSGGARYFWIPINQTGSPTDGTDNSLSVTVEVGAALRQLAGQGATDALLNSALGSTQRRYWGPEAVFTIQVRQLSAFVTATNFGKDSRGVDGLTGFQSLFGFSLEAPIFTF